jgi:prevent-host-death family protein
MTTATVHEAKTHLSRLIEKALAGESVVVTRGKEPVVRLVPVAPQRKPRHFGGARHSVIRIADDFDAPLDDFAEYEQ